MTLKYGRVENIAKRLAGRITVGEVGGINIPGVTDTQIGTDLIEMIGESTEEFVDMFLGMIYVLPLVRDHSFVRSIVEKLIVSEVYATYFPTQSESSDSSDSFGNNMRLQALNDFQALFNGLGIFVPGSTSATVTVQNDPGAPQMQNKAIILPGEKIKPFIGYDYDGDSVTDTDMFKLNTSVQPSFYTTGDFEKLQEGQSVLNGVRVRSRTNYRNTDSYPDIDFIN